MLAIQSLTSADREWVKSWMVEYWGSEMIAIHGEAIYPAEFPGFKATIFGTPVGLITYRIVENECEIISLNSTQEGRGIGSMLLNAVKEVAQNAGNTRLWLITTNDNLDALRFYQNYGFALVCIHKDAIRKSRQLKPQIPEIGHYGIPIQDEIELELKLD
jgi:ribosomal protein S18 acetylase RimI-like enzyme